MMARGMKAAYGTLLLLWIACCASYVATRLRVSIKVDGTSNAPRRRLLDNKHSDFQHLRFLAFGTSRTYGVGIRSPYKSFPYLLSRNNTKNVAMKASGPQYSALCTQTMVGNDDDGLYDVILFEYNLLADDYLEILARRLRARFPHAIMIFMRIWLPFQYTHLPSNKAVLPMVHERFGASNKGRHTTTQILSNLVEGTQPDDWNFHERADKMALLERIASSVGGHVYDMPRPQNAIEALAGYAKYYTPDMNHFSQAGHRFFQQEMVKLLHELNAQPTTQLGTWIDVDACTLWYDTGIVPNDVPYKAPMVNFLSTRHALEFATEYNYLGFKNPFWDRPVSVWIDYVAGSPMGQYPKSIIRMAGSPSVEIDPLLRGSATLHVMKHARIGMLQPGEHAKVFVDALDKDALTNFRIVGMIYTTLELQDGFRVE